MTNWSLWFVNQVNYRMYCTYIQSCHNSTNIHFPHNNHMLFVMKIQSQIEKFTYTHLGSVRNTEKQPQHAFHFSPHRDSALSHINYSPFLKVDGWSQIRVTPVSFKYEICSCCSLLASFPGLRGAFEDDVRQADGPVIPRPVLQVREGIRDLLTSIQVCNQSASISRGHYNQNVPEVRRKKGTLD